MNLKIKAKILTAVSFFLLLLLSFFVVFSLLMRLYKRDMIGANIVLVGSLVLSFAIAIVICVYSHKQNKKILKNKFDIWLHKNKASLMLFIFFLSICSLNMREELSWTYEKVKETLTLEWTILGFTMALFVVWHTIIPKFLANKKPDRKMISSIDKAMLIEEKYDFFQMVSSSFGSIALLSLNLFFLIFTTCYVYILNDDVTLFGQNITIISFLFCTNSFVDMFFGVLPPLLQAKEDLLQHANVTQEDFKFVETVAKQLEETSAFFATVDSLEGIDEADKEKIKLEAAKKFLLIKGVNYDQL